MSKSTLQTDAAAFAREIRALQKQRKTWEDGLFKSSNKELYSILERCHTVLQQLREDRKLRKALTKALDDLGIPSRSNTSPELKVVRSVFGSENNRIYAYVRVLQTAKADLPNDQKFSDWIEEHGGVEEIRRKPKDGPSAAELAKRHRELAEERLFSETLISPRFTPDDSLQPAPDGDYAFSVALVRIEPDGKAGIIFGSGKTTLVRAVLSEAGKRLSEAGDAMEPVAEARAKNQSREQSVSGFINYDDEIECVDDEATLAA
ncbi:hypothetical protein [Thalassobaculum litoreum]|uniref:Uncharacterized protein n=1 Tax=Thalassobaculum litoreum DSM 18839 TaxID=1123362 RepID=A0A8G2BKJ3_9PROT|nr:hypothetical protein [Thalassobaculum litoreum]SDF82252.1 hypothetical protein SAMN05660686_02411 [Thalassobaculum litoreum DSM 18839]